MHLICTANSFSHKVVSCDSFMNDFVPGETPEAESQTLRAILQVRELLIQGAFKPRERIKEVPLAARLHVSRTPLRLALDRLSHEGLVEMGPKGGFFAREFTVAQILDAIDLRGILEGTAARWAAERLQNKEEVRPLFECVRATKELLDRNLSGVDTIGEYMVINGKFHSLLLDLAKSEMLATSMERVLALPFASFNTFVLAGSEAPEMREMLLISNHHHSAIADAIANREGTRAEAIAREHSRNVRGAVILALQEQRLDQIPAGSLIKLPHAS
jgi:GntR family transcriptional regulator, vanillate catabolism transcriptional regulator